ncbi:MAG: hypothetical protein RR906_04240 [Acetivibrio sp.]
MLGKLCKHEFKATARWFLPLYAIALLLTPITRITNSFGFRQYEGFFSTRIFSFIQGIVTMAYVSSLLVIGAACFLLIIYRFYKSMVTEEGYLMHTLPVSTSSLIWSKLLVAFLWSIASILVIALSLLLMFYKPGCFSPVINSFSAFFQEIKNYNIGGQSILLCIEVILLLIISAFTQPLIYYAAIAIGQIISKNKIAGAIGGFFIIQIATQVISVLCMIPFGFYMNNFNNKINAAIQSVQAIPDVLSFVSGIILPLLILLSILGAGVLFLITNFSFKRKLNLE